MEQLDSVDSYFKQSMETMKDLMKLKETPVFQEVIQKVNARKRNLQARSDMLTNFDIGRKDTSMIYQPRFKKIKFEEENNDSISQSPPDTPKFCEEEEEEEE